jgi:hypothetical protein
VRADALAAEVAAAVMAGADPFAATRANSVASPESARDSPYAPRAAARLDAYGARRGSPPEAPPYAVSVSDSAETTPFASPSARRDNSAPDARHGRMHDAFFSLGARSEPAGPGPGPPSPSESPPPSIAARFEPAARQAAQRLPFSSRAAGSGLGAREHPEDDVGAEDGVGPAAETRGRAANRDRRASTSSSSSDSSSSSRSSSPDAAEARHSHPGVSLPQKEIVSPVERAALYDAEESEPPTPTQDLAFLVGATLGGARARGSEVAGAPAEAEAAAASAAKRAAAAEAAAPAAAPGTPDWSRLVDENLERRGAGEGGSSVAAAAPPPEASAALRALWRTDFEASSFADPPPAPAAPAAAPPARGDRSPSSPSAAPPTHFLAAAAARASSTRQVAPPSPKRKPPQHPRAAPPPPPPPPAPGPVNKRKKSMIKSMFKGMFSSSSGGGKKKRDKDNKK